jgi:hypothetical protein
MLKRYFSIAALIAVAVAFAAQPIIVKPGVYDPDKTGIVTAAWVPHTGVPNSPGDGSDHGLILQKAGPTAANAAAGAQITGAAGFNAATLLLGFDVKGYCGAGSPRFNVYTEQGPYYFYGCAYGIHTNLGNGWTHVAFTAADAFKAGVGPAPAVGTVSGIEIVADEGTDVGSGSSIIDNITINGVVVGKPGGEK